MPFSPNLSPLSHRDAAHLLTRAGFGATRAEVERACADGLETTVARLLTPQTETASFEKTESLLRRSALSGDNIASLKAWWVYRMANSANPLLEKAALFWHNHFATSWAKVKSVRAMADQNDLIRQHALGKFRDLATGMMRDVAMLEWLDANANRKRHPNENLARELMELFTLGIGNYNETDIKEAARALTGWHVKRGEFWMHSAQHDTGTKTVFGKSGSFGGEDIVGLCLAHEACPRFLATKLLKTFLCPKPTEALVADFAKTIRGHDYDIGAALGELFRSAEFFAPEHRAAIIKSPAELVAGTARTVGLRAKLTECAQTMADLGQNLFDPPTVKGWEGGRLWINSASLMQRANFAAEVAAGKRYGPVTGELPEDLAALLLPNVASPDFPKNQNASGRLQFLMSLPEYQLV